MMTKLGLKRTSREELLKVLNDGRSGVVYSVVVWGGVFWCNLVWSSVVGYKVVCCSLEWCGVV